MNLQGSITELQDHLVGLYVEMGHRFKENQLIRDLWNSMAQDITLQKRSMGAIPHSFWNRLKGEEDGLSEALVQAKKQIIEIKEDLSLRNCFEHALLYEEPAILKVYVPIIRKLRENWTDQALDFYIMVKAHLARITRVTQSFAGDPVVLQRSKLLQQRFEKEVQEPHIVLEIKPRKVPAAPPAPIKAKQPAKENKKTAAKKAPTLAKHANKHHGRGKPLVEKVALQRRRASR